jgi:phage-related protein
VLTPSKLCNDVLPNLLILRQTILAVCSLPTHNKPRTCNIPKVVYMDENYKELIFRSDTEEFIATLDESLKRRIGFALWQAQIGKKAPSAKPLGGNKEFKSGNVMEIVAEGDRDTYRTVYTVEFKEAIYVVDTFQKKSKRGIATPQGDIDRIVQRIKALRKEREAPAAQAYIAELLAKHSLRQQIIEEKRKKQHEPK